MPDISNKMASINVLNMLQQQGAAARASTKADAKKELPNNTGRRDVSGKPLNPREGLKIKLDEIDDKSVDNRRRGVSGSSSGNKLIPGMVTVKEIPIQKAEP